MDVLDYVLIQATAYALTYPERTTAVIRGVAWVTTILPYAQAIIGLDHALADVLPDRTDQVLDVVEEVLEVTLESAEVIGEQADRQSLETSVEIGGPGVEAQIAEIAELQAEHAEAVKNLTDQFSEQRREQLAAAEEMEQKYFERHPDQTEAERQRDAQMLEGVKQDAMNDLSAKQEAQMAELLQEQQRELQQLQERQVAQDQREAQVRAEFRENRDDLVR